MTAQETVINFLNQNPELTMADLIAEVAAKHFCSDDEARELLDQMVNDGQIARDGLNLMGYKLSSNSPLLPDRTVRNANKPTIYVSLKDTNALIRKALAEAFPGVKFSVVGKSYSMGASTTVRWLDGPTPKQVEKVAKQFEGSTFDGMIDLKSSVYHTDEQGNQYHYGADYVHCTREYSDEFSLAMAQKVADYFDLPVPAMGKYGFEAGETIGNKGWNRSTWTNMRDEIGTWLYHATYYNGVIAGCTQDSWYQSLVNIIDGTTNTSVIKTEIAGTADEPAPEMIVMDTAQVVRIVNADKPAHMNDVIALFDGGKAILEAQDQTSTPAVNPAIEALKTLNVDALSPLEALTKLYELKRLAQS